MTILVMPVPTGRGQRVSMSSLALIWRFVSVNWMVAKSFELVARHPRYGGQLTALLAQSMQETCSGQISDTSPTSMC